MHGNAIDIPRGTTHTIEITLYDESGNRYVRTSGDIVRFGVKHNPDDATCVISKTGTYNLGNFYTVTLSPEDTANLIMGEQYWYDIGLQTASGDFFQVVEVSPFNVKRAITKKVTT